MAISKKSQIPEILITLFFIIFPFGQLIRIPLGNDIYNVTLHPIDIIAGLSTLYLVFKHRSVFLDPTVFGLLSVMLLSWTISLPIFGESSIIGFLYLMRFVSYIGFFKLIRVYLVQDSENANKIFQYLYANLVILMIFGWIQFFYYYDLTKFTVWGWDDHLYRLTGTLFDPAYMGLLMVIGALLSLDNYLKAKNKSFLLAFSLFSITVGYTYSRASYMAVFVGLLYYIFTQRKKIFIPLSIVGIILGISILPNFPGVGSQLSRTFSIFARLQNYRETVEIWFKNPLFGIGFNNLCAARKMYLGDISYQSHACSGSDSSILFILATMGLAGILVFWGVFSELLRKIKHSELLIVTKSILIAVFIHAVFSNSLFYPWITYTLLILISLNLVVIRRN